MPFEHEFDIDNNKHRNSHRSCSAKKGAFKYFSKFTGKHLGWSLFLIKLLALRPATLLKRDSNTSVFLSNLRNSTNFEERLRTTVSVNNIY